MLMLKVTWRNNKNNQSTTLCRMLDPFGRANQLIRSLSIFVEEVVDLLFDRHDSSAGKWLQLVVNLSVIEGNGPNGLG